MEEYRNLRYVNKNIIAGIVLVGSDDYSCRGPRWRRTADRQLVAG
jgi:hypothetical protein